MLKPEVIYENENFLVLNKPAGLLVHGTLANSKSLIANKEEALADWLVEKYPETKKVGDDPETRPGIVHRLDKDTSGVMVVARNQKTFEYLKKLFQEHKIQKTYRVLVYGRVKNKKGIIDKPIGIKAGTTKRSVFSEKMKKEAVTEYRLASSIKYQVSGRKGSEKSLSDFSLLEVKPKTGRTHQIRVHLASIGHSVVNDVLYSKSKQKIGNGRLMLHAMSLEFAAENGKRMQFEAELPEDFNENINELESRK
ncbi:MAG: RNA pseudouridine synthase [Patescibacteria group bacterium]